MNRRERLLATLRGRPVDRPPVSFYEINGMDQWPDDPDPFNIFSHPSWRPLIELARDKTDRMPMRGVVCAPAAPDPLEALTRIESREEADSRLVTRTITLGRRRLVTRTRRNRDVNTVWTVEHLLKNTADLRLFLRLPPRPPAGAPNPAPVHNAEAALSDTGLVVIDTADPLCMAASLFDMATYTVVAMTERRLFTRLLDRFAAELWPRIEAVAAVLPGRLWRICGPEYATPPYLPPALFREYVCRYVAPMVDAIHRHGGYARIHCHGKLRAILGDIAALGADGLDPIEPPPQGDVELREVRAACGAGMALFGNLEASDIENLPPARFAEKVRRALDEGTAGPGRGFVLMPSACPYGRVLSTRAMRNYETMVEAVEKF